MDTIADYNAWVAKRQQNGVGAAQVVLGSVEEAPDQVAGDLNLASEFGKVTGNPVPPAPMVKEYRNVFQQKIEQERAKTILSRSPVLTEWLRNPENAAVSRDDLENLSWFEGFARGAGNTLSRAGERLGQVGNTYMLNQTAGRFQDRASTFGDILESERDVISTAKGDVRLMPMLGDFVSAAGRWVDAKYADLIGADDEGAAREYAATLQANIDKMRATPKSQIATEFEGAAMVDGATLGQALQNFGAAVVSNPLGALSWALETAGESAPQLAVAVGITAATRNPVAGAAAIGAGSYTTERYVSVADFLSEKGINLGNADDVGRVLSEPELLKEANDRGVIRGLVISAFDMVSAGLAGRVLAGNPLIEAVAQGVQQAVNGALGEFSARLAAGQELDWNEIIAEGFAEIATAPVDMGVAGRRIVTDRRKANEAEDTVAKLGEIGAQAQASKLRERMPDKFRQLVERATENGPVENVFIPADEFVTYFQGMDIDPFALIDEFEGVTRDDLETALAGGGDLRIPTATYAAKIAGSEHDAFLMENMRFDPNEFTAREAAEFNERAQDALAEAWEVAEAVRVEREQLSAIEDQIYDSMVSRLRTAGRSTDVATSEALLYPAFYRVMAERSGMTTEEFLGKYPLPEVRGDLPEGMQLRDTDELTRTLAEARARRAVGADKRGPSLLEFISDYGGINDIGGELRSRNAETVKRGKGKKTLKLSRAGVMAGARDLLGATGGKKHGVDDVALAALEAGFMANEPEVMEFRAAMNEGREVPDITLALWNAIDRELRGEAQYVPDADADARAAEEARLDEIEQYLSSLGVSLNDDDAVIRQALEGARQYGQSGTVDLTPGGGAKELRLGDTVIDYGISRDGQTAEIILVKTPKAKRGGGSARRALGELLAAFDTAGLTTFLTAEPMDKGVSKAKLTDFYKSLGFKENKGKNKDFRSQASMVREPARSYNQSAFHGTPHLFERFSTENIGTGEGNQSFGWGLYFASKREVADWYRNALTRAGREFRYQGKAISELKRGDVSPEAWQGISLLFGAKSVKDAISLAENSASRENGRMKDYYEAAAKWLNSAEIEEIGVGRTYAVEIPDDADLMNFDAPLSQQPEKIQEAFRSVGINDMSISGGEAYTRLSSAMGKHVRIKGSPFGWGIAGDVFAKKAKVPDQKAASIALSRAGVPGHRYVGTESQSTNYVIYDDSRVSVTSYEQSGNLGPRGQIQFSPGGIGKGETVVRLFQSADLSTFLHESGHYFLSVLQDMAGREAASAGNGGTVLFHGSPANDLTLDKIEIIRASGQKQGKKGRVYGGFYAADESRVSDAEGYAGEGGTVYRIELKPDAVVEQKEGDITRLTEQAIDEYRARGVDVIVGKDPRGRTEYAIINRDAINSVEDRSKPTAARLGRAATEFATVKSWWRSNADAVAKDAMRVMPDVTVTADDVISALDNGTTGDVLRDAAIDVGMQEQWARGFEAYLMEGKAPSADLRSAFEKFRAWLISIYQRLAGLQVSISDDIRGVFDRMIATDEEIAKAQSETGGNHPLFASAEEMGLTPDEYSAFMKLLSQAEDDAKARLLRETMEPVKRAQEKWFKDERAKTREDVAREVNSIRYYRAIEWMGNRRWLGEDQPESLPDIRLSKDILVDRYGKGVLDTLPRGKQTVYTVEGGIDPDEAAGWFGFESGDEMIRAMEKAPKRKEAIEAETDRVMRERHGDALNDGRIEAEALAAVHTDKKGQWIAAELNAVIDVAGTGVKTTAKEMRHTARQTLARMRVKDATSAGRFLAAERKAAEEAARLGAMLAREGVWMGNARRRIATKARAAMRGEGTVEAVAPQIERANASTGNYNETVAQLIEAKRRQLLNHSLYSEALKIADEVEKAERLVARLEKSTRKIRAERKRFGEASIAGDYVDAIEAIIYGYEFRKVSNKQIDRRAALLAYVARMTEEGRANELAIPQAVLDDAAVKNYRTLTVEHLRGVVDSLQNLEHTARLKGKLLIAKKQRDFEEAVSDIVGAIETNVGARDLDWIGDDSITGRAREAVNGYISTFQSATTILRQIDGREDLGVAYETLKTDMDDAAYTEREMRKVATDDIMKLYAVYSTDEQRQMAVRRVIPELGGKSFSKWNLLAMALNMGNEGNIARLTNEKAQMHLTPAQVEAVKGLLDERDARFVQSIWDYIASFRPMVIERDRRISGVEPAWVDPAPVTIGGVDLKGGYYPIKYEGRLGGAQFSGTDDDIMKELMAGGYSSAGTKNGHLKARGADTKQSLTLDIGVIAQHTNEVIHDLAFSEAVVNTMRLLTNTAVDLAFKKAGLAKQHEMLKLWVKDAATGQVAAGSDLARSVQLLRSGFTYSKLALNLKTILLQPLGLMQSAVVVGKRNLANQILRYMQNPVAMTNDVLGRSRMMWERRETFNKDLMDAAARKNIASPAASKLRAAMDDYVIPFGMAGITYSQFYLVDVPTWAAAYSNGLKQFGGDQKKAAQFADMTVQRSQSSGIWSDRSGIERGTLSGSMRQNPFVMLLTTLGSYFFAKMNLVIERAQGVAAEPFSVGRSVSYALDMTLLLAGEAAVIALLSEMTDDDDDDDDTLVGTIASEALRTFLAGLPVVRDAVGLYDGFSGGTYTAILELPVKAGQQAMQGEVDRAFVKSVVNLTGMMLRLPSSQVNRIIDAGWRDLEGEDVSPLEYLVGKSRK